MVYEITKKIVKPMLPPRPAGGHKGTFGTLWVAGGCRQYRGAPALAAQAALHSGAGIVGIASIEAVCAPAAAWLACCIFHPLPESSFGGLAANAAAPLLEAPKTALLVGCGLGVNTQTAAFVKNLLAKVNCPLVLDADALNCLSQEDTSLSLLGLQQQTGQPPILTPHLGEMARLLHIPIPEVEANQQHIAGEYARQYGCVVVLKSATTVVAAPDGKVYLLQQAENSALAKGGSGDVLSGIIAGLLAQGISALHASVAGVWLHSAAAAQGAAQYSCSGFSPAQLPELLAPLWLELNR